MKRTHLTILAITLAALLAISYVVLKQGNNTTEKNYQSSSSQTTVQPKPEENTLTKEKIDQLIAHTKDTDPETAANLSMMREDPQAFKAKNDELTQVVESEIKRLKSRKIQKPDNNSIRQTLWVDKPSVIGNKAKR